MAVGDPKPRRGGLCARPGCKNKVYVITTAAKTFVLDPFCSTQCCKVYWGVISEKERAAAEMHAEKSKPVHKAKPIKK